MCSPINRLVPALLIAFALVPSQARAEEIIIGARGDARPFIWEDAVTGQHLGFLWDICTEATRRAKFQIAPQSIGARERRLFLTAGAGGFDLLCDPTTVTLARLQRFAEQDSLRHLSFSPIVFVANGTYVYQSDEKSNGRGKLPEDIGKLKAGCKALRARGPQEYNRQRRRAAEAGTLDKAPARH